MWTAIIDGYQFSSGNNVAAVKQQIQLLLRNKQSFEKMLKNATPYIGYIYQKVNERKMPTEIVLLPVIESGYDPFAYSSVGATGLWQMMPATAAGDYDLSIDWWYDQRRDIQASTTSALNYLQRLDRQFDNWLLALAAYNTGQGNVEKSIRAAKSTGKSSDYWNLSLPKQTRDYVPNYWRLLILPSMPLSMASRCLTFQISLIFNRSLSTIKWTCERFPSYQAFLLMRFEV